MGLPGSMWTEDTGKQAKYRTYMCTCKASIVFKIVITKHKTIMGIFEKTSLLCLYQVCEALLTLSNWKKISRCCSPTPTSMGSIACNQIKQIGWGSYAKEKTTLSFEQAMMAIPYSPTCLVVHKIYGFNKERSILWIAVVNYCFKQNGLVKRLVEISKTLITKRMFKEP